MDPHPDPDGGLLEVHLVLIEDEEHLAHAEGDAHRTQLVAVLVERGVELDQDAVADELVEDPFELDDRVDHVFEVAVDHLHEEVRPDAFREAGEVPDVGHHDREDALFATELDLAGEDRIGDRTGDVLAEHVLDAVTVAQTLNHLVETLGQEPGFVAGDDWQLDVELSFHDDLVCIYQGGEGLDDEVREPEAEEEDDDHHPAEQGGELVATGKERGFDGGDADGDAERADWRTADDEGTSQLPVGASRDGDRA